jgi:heme-degrading monooxygenase HmoA
MVTEIALLQIVPGTNEAFKQSFHKAEKFISSMKGYVEHSLEQCMEVENKFLLLVKWKTLEDHTIGFRQSEAYKDWKQLLHHFYDPFPVVEHYQKIEFAESKMLEA